MSTTSMPAPPASASLLNPNRMLTVLVCAATGLLGGLALMPAAHATVVTGPVLGLLYGVLFALLFSKRAPARALACCGVSVMRCYCGWRWSR